VNGVAGDAQSRLERADAAHKILERRCVSCHGASKQEGELRLDVESRALVGGQSGQVLLPGKPDDSLLIAYVRGKGETVMPPEGAELSDAEVAILTDWVRDGAHWPQGSSEVQADPRLEHWSFQPVRCTPPPAVKNPAWTRSPIDRFIAAGLERNRVTPSQEADRRTLVRRLSFDLIGLPPTTEDVERFVGDSSPDAYERVVDRLLDSPHFGERWGRHWLDRARYADSSGCVIDLERPFAWRWRDWVIEAINNDLPFDQFTIDQIAGDLLPNATAEDRVAVGFHQNALTNHEGGTDLEAERVKTTLDRATAVGAAWLGLTVGCAQCHSHKHDPISQRDFYAFYAFFDNLEDYLIDAPPTGRSLDAALARRELDAARDRYLAVTSPAQRDWEQKVARAGDVWKTPRDFDSSSLRSTRSAMVHPLDDGSLFVDGRLSSSDTYVITFKSPVAKLTAVRIESLPDPWRFDRGPGRGNDQRALVTGISIQTSPVDSSQPKDALPIGKAVADYCQTGFAVEDAIRRGEETGWALDQIGVPHVAAFFLAKPCTIDADGRMTVRLEHSSGRGRNLNRFRISVTDAAPEELSEESVPQEITTLARRPETERTPEERAALKRYYQCVTAPNAADLASWQDARSRYAAVCGEISGQSVHERSTPRETFVHLRGDFRRPGEKTEPALLPALGVPAPRGRRLNRLDLARGLVDPANTLTARVAANDCWQHLFGAGLVDTPADFGLQGDPPSHPELLDWLASELVRSGWSRKALIRTIVCSATYRQSSAARPELFQLDPNNRFLARQNRFRLEAESVRDTALACSGTLDRRIGGPGFPAASPKDDPPEDWRPQYRRSTADDTSRRGLYAITKRTRLDALSGSLDAPDATASCAMRRCTNTPVQSLALMNDPVFVMAANALAEATFRVSDPCGDAALRDVFTRCLAREPSATELATLRELYANVLAGHPDTQTGSETVRDSRKIGHPAQADAWFVVCRTILNLDETLTRE
jgi:hypothetical protein